MTTNSILQPKFSLIIPVFNRGHIIGEVLENIFKIDHSNFEVIIVDDGSTDNSVEIIKKYPCKLIQYTYNTGPAYGRNKGAEHANGEILIFVDSDMILPPDTLKILDRVFADSNSSAVITLLSHKIRFNNFASNYKNLYFHYMFKIRNENVHDFASGVSAIKREAFFDIGGYDINFGLTPCEDQEIGERITQKYKIYLCKELQTEHVKHYNWLQVLQTGFFRSECLLKLLLRKRFTNAKKQTPPKGFIWGIILAGFQVLFLILGILHTSTLTYANSGSGIDLDMGGTVTFLLLSLFCSIIMIIINFKFLRFVLQSKGFLFFIKSSLFLHLELLFMGLGISKGLFSYVAGEKY